MFRWLLASHLWSVLGVLGLALIASSCGASKADLRAAARSLVPPEARVIAHEPGACVEFASFPSCEMFWFSIRGRSMPERIDLVNGNARRLGWKSTDSAGGDGGTTLSFRKGPFDASVTIWSALHDYFCKARPVRGARNCVDHLLVTRR